ncbi:AAA family ATPase [Niabella sp. CJ426]|uniref:AAA family ATPase n=1 Tax=Niabella sp. CJ426 TaxID=3393740 RepID=UPI003D089C97
MVTHQLRIKTENFRAISQANIVIDGITVVAGENGSGKSTLSKLLYFFYKTASNYNKLVGRELRYKLRDIERFLEIMVSDIHSISNQRNTREEYEELRSLRHGIDDPTEEEMHKWIAFIEKVTNNYYSQPSLFKGDKPINPRISNRLKYIIRDILGDLIPGIDPDTLPFNLLIKVVRDIFAEAFGKMKSRPTSLFLNELSSVFTDGNLPEKFEVFEFEEQIVSINTSSLSIPYLIQNVIYIDSPMSLGVVSSDNEYWDDLNELLLEKGKSNFSALSEIISRDIISGDVTVDEGTLASDDFTFKRSDGSIYNLLDVATGIKSFAILQLLIKNGSLTDKTLVIMDEPESHLHPQWIIEYARLIVLLSKEIGVRFFIASHNPDMVSALKYISEKQGTNETLNYYLAEKANKKFSYDYTHLGKEIDPIFQSFNIAIDRISQYGS